MQRNDSGMGNDDGGGFKEIMVMMTVTPTTMTMMCLFVCMCIDIFCFV